jgi:multidrug efflux pump subunit AcrA (membrane-fusion protein)
MVESDQDKQNRETEAEHGVAIPHAEDDGKMHLYSHSKSHVDPRAEVSLKSNIQLFIVICFLAGAFFLSQILEPEKERVVKNSGKRTLLVKTVNISPATQRVSFERTGTVTARNLIAIAPQVSGRVVSVDSSFRSGSIFSANKTLFRIDGQDFQHQVDIAGAELATAEARLEVARAEHEASTDEWYSLNPGKEIPPLVARLPQLNEAKSAFSAAKARLSDAKLDLERSRYKLPYDGYVVESSIEEGQFVQSGQPHHCQQADYHL